MFLKIAHKFESNSRQFNRSAVEDYSVKRQEFTGIANLFFKTTFRLTSLIALRKASEKSPAVGSIN